MEKSKKRKILIILIVTFVLILTIGVVYALWNYFKVGSNQELISGNIYMKYTETNQIKADGMMPLDISKCYSEDYKVNPNMTEEELASCESFFSSKENIGAFQENETPRAFCEGTGTAQGGQATFQEMLDNLSSAPQEIIEQQLGELIENNVILKIKKFKTSYDHYKVNPSMTSEELASCESFFEENFSQMFQNEETTRAFCEGTGTTSGLTFQGVLDGGYLNVYLEDLLSKNIISKETIELSKIPYFEFNIEGTNDYTKDIWYEIVLSYGDEPEDIDRDTRIKDYLLRFRLVEVVDGKEKEIFTNRNYESLIKEKIWVDKVSAKTEKEIKRVYRLYMWIGNETTIGNTDGVDYNDATWKKVYASIKVNVNGDFTPKEIDYKEPSQPARCFMTQEFDHNGDTEIMITDYDTDCGTKVNIPEEINGHKVTVIGSAYKESNDGYIQPMVFSTDENQMSFYQKEITSVVIPNTVRTIGSGAFSNNNLTKVEIPDSVEWIDEYAFVYNQLEEVTIGSGIKYIGRKAFGENGVNGTTHYGTFKTLKVKKSCNEIKNIPVSFEYQDTYYPWTCYVHEDGLKVYGYENGEEKFCEVKVPSCQS